MPLQGDQKALLQLLCERGQSYEDISGLLGIEPDEVRERARAALTEIGGSDPDQGDVPLTDYLLGQADPIGRADAVRHLQADPEALALAERIQAELRELAPDAKQPKLPEARGKRRRAALPSEGDTVAAPSAPKTGTAGTGGGSSNQSRLIAVVAAVGVILIVAILLIADVFSGGDDSTTATTATDSTSATTGADGENITTVELQPTGSSGVAGEAIFGLISNEQLYVDIDVQGLDPQQSQGSSYLVWLMVGEDAGYPIDRLEADQNGSFSGRLAVPTAIAVAVGNQARSVVVSSTSVRELQQEIEKAAQQQVPILPFIGDELAAGDIPLVEDPASGSGSGSAGGSGGGQQNGGSGGQTP